MSEISVDNAGPPIRVVVVEDQNDVREAFASILRTTPGFACAGAFADAESAIAQLRDLTVDVVLMDIGLPGMSGIEAVAHLRREGAGPQVMILTVFEDEARIFDSLRAGANGYVLKSMPPGQLLAAIRSLHDGGSPMSSSIARRVVEAFHETDPSPDPAAELTPRQREILTLLVDGHQYKSISRELGISLDTVRTHVRHIYEKMQVRSRTQATARYLRWQGRQR